MLNTNDEDADIQITVYYTDREPVGPYKLRVPARRVRHVRFNDLINPEALPLDKDYASVIVSNVPVIVQFCRNDTSQAENAIASTMAFPAL